MTKDWQRLSTAQLSVLSGIQILAEIVGSRAVGGFRLRMRLQSSRKSSHSTLPLRPSSRPRSRIRMVRYIPHAPDVKLAAASSAFWPHHQHEPATASPKQRTAP